MSNFISVQRKSFLLLEVILILFIGGASMNLYAGIRTSDFTYEHDGVELEGFFAYDDSIKGKRPGVLIIHEWNGLGDYVKNRAEQLASEGYVAFAMDMYGKGIRPTTPEESGQQAGI